MIFVIGFAFFAVGWLVEDGWPAIGIGGGLVAVGTFSYLDGVL